MPLAGRFGQSDTLVCQSIWEGTRPYVLRPEGTERLPAHAYDTHRKHRGVHGPYGIRRGPSCRHRGLDAGPCCRVPVAYVDYVRCQHQGQRHARRYRHKVVQRQGVYRGRDGRASLPRWPQVFLSDKLRAGIRAVQGGARFCAAERRRAGI